MTAPFAAWVFAAWVLAACAPLPIAPSPEGYLDVMGGYPPFGLGATEDEAERRGFFKSAPPFATGTIDNDGRALRLATPSTGGSPGGVIGRVIDAPLLAASFLSWRWRRETPGREDLPVTLLIGFSGGDGPVVRENPQLPRCDRILTIAGANLPRAATARGAYARFVVGSSEENTWRRQAVDLSELHRKFWPRIPPVEVRIRFIAIAEDRSERPAVTDIADLLLAH